MVKILLACSAGMSTSLMVKKMKKVADENGLEVEISAVPESQAEGHFENLNIL
ncbi:PTS sugar transporter subunit IIB, partial [Cetobacterium sp.]